MTYYQEIHKDKIEYELQQKYSSELAELQSLGFDEIYHTREVVFPLSALLFPYMYPIMRLKGEVVKIESPLRFVLLYPVIFNRAYDTYAHAFGMGVKFATLFMDDTVLISTNYRSKSVIKPERKIYRYTSNKSSSITELWQQHQHRIVNIEKKGCETQPDMSMGHYERIMHRDDKAILFGR